MIISVIYTIYCFFLQFNLSRILSLEERVFKFDSILHLNGPQATEPRQNQFGNIIKSDTMKRLIQHQRLDTSDMTSIDRLLRSILESLNQSSVVAPALLMSKMKEFFASGDLLADSSSEVLPGSDVKSLSTIYCPKALSSIAGLVGKFITRKPYIQSQSTMDPIERRLVLDSLTRYIRNRKRREAQERAAEYPTSNPNEGKEFSQSSLILSAFFEAVQYFNKDKTLEKFKPCEIMFERFISDPNSPYIIGVSHLGIGFDLGTNNDRDIPKELILLEGESGVPSWDEELKKIISNYTNYLCLVDLPFKPHESNGENGTRMAKNDEVVEQDKQIFRTYSKRNDGDFCKDELYEDICETTSYWILKCPKHHIDIIMNFLITSRLGSLGNKDWINNKFLPSLIRELVYSFFCVSVFLAAEKSLPNGLGRLRWPPSPAILELHLRFSANAMELYIRHTLDSIALIGSPSLPFPYSNDDRLKFSFLNDLTIDIRRSLNPWLNPFCPVGLHDHIPVITCRSQPWIPLSHVSVHQRDITHYRQVRGSQSERIFKGSGLNYYPTLERRFIQLRPWVAAYHKIGQFPRILSNITHSYRLSSTLLDSSGHWNDCFDVLPTWASAADQFERHPNALMSRALHQLTSMTIIQDEDSRNHSRFELLLQAVRKQLNIFTTAWLSWKALTTQLEHLTVPSFLLLRRVEPDETFSFILETMWDSASHRNKMGISVDRFIVPETSMFELQSDALDRSSLLRMASVPKSFQ